MAQGTMQVPGAREWLWSFFPWGLLFAVGTVGAMASGVYRTGVLMLAALLGYAAFMKHNRRLCRQSFLRVTGERLVVAGPHSHREFAFHDISHVGWQLGHGSPMWSPTATPPKVRVTLMSGEVVEVELFFAGFWTESRAVEALTAAMAPVVVRG